MTARWHLGPVSDWYFWQVLAFSPEILVFLFFMITDPKTIPAGRTGRRVYAVAIGLLAALLIAPQTTEFGAEGRGALGARDRLRRAAAARAARRARPSSRLVGWAHRTGGDAAGRACGSGGVHEPARRRRDPGPLERRSGDPVDRTKKRASRRHRAARARDRAGRPGSGTTDRADVVADLENESEALRRRDPARATAGADGARLAALWQQIRAATGRAIVVPDYRVDRVRVSLEPAAGQEPPTVVALVTGTVQQPAGRAPFARDVRARAQAGPLPDRRLPGSGGRDSGADEALGGAGRRAAARRRRVRSGSTSGRPRSASGCRTSRRR